METMGRRKVAEVRSLTGLRGVAAIWVVLLHAGVARPWNLLWTFISNGYMAVDIFFCLSGYVMALNYSHFFHRKVRISSYASFLSKRFARTYPLYVATTLVVFAFIYYGYIPSWKWPAQVCNLSSLVPNLLLIQNWNTRYCSINAPGWSMSTEWGAYLLFPLLCKPTLYANKWHAMLAVVASISVLTVIAMIPRSILGQSGNPSDPLFITSGQTLAASLRCLAGFTLGLASYRLAGTRFGNALAANGIFSPIVSAMLIVLFCLKGADIAAVCIFPLLIVSLSHDKSIIAKILTSKMIYYIGVISYSIYLVQVPIIIFVERVDPITSKNYREYSVEMISVFCCVLMASLTYHFLERPARGLLGDMFSRLAVSFRVT